MRSTGFILILLAALVGPAAAADIASEPGNSFISPDTVVVGCTAGAAAGALTLLLPAIALAVTEPAIGLVVTRQGVIHLAGIGCAVGVMSGLAAIGTAVGLKALRDAMAPSTRQIFRDTNHE